MQSATRPFLGPRHPQGARRALAPGPPARAHGRPAHSAAARRVAAARAPPQVLSLNGEAVLNLRHLAELVAGCQEPYLRFDCEYREVIILEREAAFRDTSQVGLAPRGAGLRGGRASRWARFWTELQVLGRFADRATPTSRPALFAPSHSAGALLNTPGAQSLAHSACGPPTPRPAPAPTTHPTQVLHDHAIPSALSKDLEPVLPAWPPQPPKQQGGAKAAAAAGRRRRTAVRT
jgi:hypothetical protein